MHFLLPIFLLPEKLVVLDLLISWRTKSGRLLFCYTLAAEKWPSPVPIPTVFFSFLYHSAVSEITCPHDVTKILEPGQAQAVIDLVEPVHSLNRIESSVPTQGHAFDVGTTEVVYTAFSNTSDSSATCSFNVVVKGVHFVTKYCYN